jgi:hypothetical protein
MSISIQNHALIKPIKKDRMATVAIMGVVSKELVSAVVCSDSRIRLVRGSDTIMLDFCLLRIRCYY